MGAGKVADATGEVQKNKPSFWGGNVAAAAIPAGLGLVGSLFGAHKQSQAQNQALQAQERARQDALAYQRQREANQQKQQAARWAQYRKAYSDWYQRYGEGGINRYGVPVGVNYKTAPAAGGPGAAIDRKSTRLNSSH